MRARSADEGFDPRDARIAVLEAMVTELTGKNAEFEAKNAELHAITGKLVERIEELEEKLGRNSRNSHLPPSSDGPGAAGRNKTKPETKAKRKRGGQKGHRGAHRLLLPAEAVDEFVELFPPSCAGCGGALPQTPDTDPRRTQLFELEVGKRHITEFRRHEVQCPRCGHRSRAAYDPKKIPSSPFGPQLVARVAMLTGSYHLSRRQAQRLLREFFGIELSLGALSGMEAKAAAALQSAYAQATRAAQDAPIKHTDATTWARAGRLMSLWTLASTSVTVYKILADGRRETIRSLFGVLKGFLVSDRASVFGFWKMKLRQICWAHLLRKFVSFSERDGPAGAIGRELLHCTVLMFQYWHGLREGVLTREEFIRWMGPLQLQFEATLARAAAAGLRRLSGSCTDILGHRDALWTFVTHEGVEPTNNHAERELRPFVLWRRRCFGSQSDRGERFAERVMTVVQSLRKQGRDVLDFLVESVRALATGAQPPALVA